MEETPLQARGEADGPPFPREDSREEKTMRDLKTRRLRRVAVSRMFLAGMLVEGYDEHTRCVHGIPSGATFVGAFNDESSMCVWFVFAHDGFEEALDGEAIPEVSITRELIRCQKELE